MKKLRLNNLYLFGLLHGASFVSAIWALTSDATLSVKIVACIAPVIVLLWRIVSIFSVMNEVNGETPKRRHKWIVNKENSNVVKMPKNRKRR